MLMADGFCFVVDTVFLVDVMFTSVLVVIAVVGVTNLQSEKC